MPESLFNKVTGLYPAASLTEKTPIQVFSDEFCEVLEDTFFDRTRPCHWFCSTEKYFTNKIVKNLLRKKRKLL